MKQFLKDNLKLMNEWNFKRNNNVDLNCLTLGSGKKVWWICNKCNNEYETTINKKSNGSGCPYCSNQKILKGYNDLATTNPELAKEWNYERNENLTPYDVVATSNKKVWWICDKGHDFNSSLYNRNKGSKCPYCSNRKVLKGYNDLVTKKPELAKEWNYKKNKKLQPDNILAGSNMKVWWKCSKCNYEWNALISSRTISGNGCPSCRGEKVAITHNATSIKKYGNILETNPELVDEWNYEKNGDLTPDNVHKWSSKKVWWKCSKCNNEWQAVINYRTISGTGCPKCNGEMQTSFPEQAIQYYLSYIFGKENVINRYLLDEKYEIDIFIKKYKIGIEYDGLYFHNSEKAKKKEEKKNLYVMDKKIKLIRIKENYQNDCLFDDLSCDIISIRKNPKFLDYDFSIRKLISRLENLINKKISCNIDTESDRFKIMENYIKIFKENSLSTINPELAKEWNYEKNGILMPEMVTSNSSKKVWWVCNKGHEWDYVISDRNHGDGCPYCSNHRVLSGYNDLETLYPNIAKEWNFEKNDSLLPSNIMAKSIKKVWWICDKGHEWFISPNSRCNGSGCPYCSNHKVLKGYNDLATTNPELIKEWDYSKNKELLPEDVVAGSQKKVWWKCSKCNHEWSTYIYNRVSNNAGCPKCSKCKQLISFNTNKINKLGSLKNNNLKLSKEWNYEKNGNLTPSDVIATSNQKVWWICSKGHEWIASISKRNNGNGCPYCSNHKVLKGYNDLATTNPELIKEWNYKRNNINPDEIVYGSYKKVWWICDKGHEWEAVINNRRNGYSKCPICKK